MERYQTSDDVRKEIIAVFPTDTGELFYELLTDVAHLHLIWRNYRSLFGTSPERIELLNWAAPLFFGLLDDVLRHDVVLAIARLTDPAQSARKEDRASLACLVRILAPSVGTALAKELRSELEDLAAYCKPIRDIRNRLLAHDDLATTLHYHPDPLPGISRAYIEGALERVRKLLGDMEERFRGSRTSHEYVVAFGDGESLILALESAREHEKCRQRECGRTYGINENLK